MSDKVIGVSIVRFDGEAVRQLRDVIRRSCGRRPKRGDWCRPTGGDRALRANRARVVAAIRDLHKRRGLSIAKAIRHLRGNDYWSSRMKGVIDRSWASYYYGK